MKTCFFIAFMWLGSMGIVLSQGDSICALYPTGAVVSEYHNNWTQQHYAKRIKSFINQPLEMGEVVFVGNSITEQGGNWSEKFGVPHIRNRGIAGDVSDGVWKRLGEITFYKPKAVFLLIGINDLFSLHREEDVRPNLTYTQTVPSTGFIAEKIVAIVQEIHEKSPSTQVYVRTVLPTRREFLKDDVVELNKKIKENASAALYTVIDLYQAFVDDHGLLTKALTTDGVHLNQSGYDQWVSFERDLLLKVVNPKE